MEKRILPKKKDMIAGLKVLGLVIVMFVCLLAFLWVATASAQSVVRKGNTFYQQSSSNKIAKDSVTFTGYHYFDTNGIRYPIYMSSKGKCFILRTSKKTGKQYKQYLPEITKQLAKE